MHSLPGRRSRRSAPPLRRRRDRRGRGIRGGLAPRNVPLHRTPSEVFDDFVLDAVEELEDSWGPDIARVEFAVEEVPPAEPAAALDADTVSDRGVPLGTLHRSGLGEVHAPLVVVYRRPVEARAMDPDDCADLVFMIVAELVAEYLGKDLEP